VPLLRYWHTLRHLKVAQVAARATRNWKSLDLRPQGGQRRRARRAAIGIDPWRSCALAANGSFTFLNETRVLGDAADWNMPAVPKLWLYNLHYFDWINARHRADAAGLAGDAAKWITRWIVQNPAPQGNGWEPYPLSLRIVNWIKWLAREPAIDTATTTAAILRSLELQAHVLSQRLEQDLLGNHLFENAKSLVFAGCFFDGALADTWFALGSKVLDQELARQILSDGGHFELSPMYHAIVLEGILDLLALHRAYPDRPLAEQGLGRDRLEHIVQRMLGWLTDMTHRDGEIAFFNDAALAIAPNLAMLTRYAERLGVTVSRRPRADGVRARNASGFVRIDRGPLSAFLDVGNIGPDNVAGHAHADNLTFEWSLGEQRVLVNSGTSLYGESRERLRQRGTAAHNTVVIDGRDSSEVWRGFRVARRACPSDVRLDTLKEPWTVSAAHDGYRRLPSPNIHRRRWEVGVGSLLVADRVEGEHAIAQARFHFHPNIEVSLCGAREGRLHGDHGLDVSFLVSKGRPWLEDSTYHPEFGRSIRNQCLVLELDRSESVIRFTFGSF
jgi:uncharacterized heparinase superfamily protein